MAVMTVAQRRECLAKLMRLTSVDRGTLPGDKDLCSDTVDAIDQWISDQRTSFNNALPAEAQAWPTPLKVRVFIAVLTDRFLSGTN